VRNRGEKKRTVLFSPERKLDRTILSFNKYATFKNVQINVTDMRTTYKVFFSQRQEKRKSISLHFPSYLYVATFLIPACKCKLTEVV
jgi:hypothetical protein